VGLAGQSGSGKSTLALALMGLLPVKGGEVSGAVVFNGKDLLSSSEKELRAIRGKEISIVLQSPLKALKPALSIGAQLREAWKAHERGSAAQGAAVIQKHSRASAYPSTISSFADGLALELGPGTACVHRCGDPAPADAAARRRGDKRS
jgi:ABC-type glutathione transport system ATPase component